jgi:serine O-acetyltransferase
MNLQYYLKEDLRATLLKRKVTLFDFFFNFFFNYKFRIVIRLRVSQYFHKRGYLGRKIALLLYWKNLRRSIDISPKSIIGYGLRIAHPIGIVIGDRVVIGNYCSILQNVTIGGNSGKTQLHEGKVLHMPYVGDFVQVSPGACILGPLIIGDFVIIGANSVITKNLNNAEVLTGIPGKVLKVQNSDDYSSPLYKLIK